MLPNGRRLTRTVQAGSSYLSSEDQRVHFGLGAATSVRSITVRYPWGGATFHGHVAANRVLRITSPLPVRLVAGTAASPALTHCTSAPRQGRSVARIWNDTALDVLRLGDASEPVQARDLFDLSTAISQAWHGTNGQQGRETAISYAAYRLLVWRASYGANLDRAFALLAGRLRGLCLSPDFTRTSGGSAAALGNRIGAAAIAAGRNDGSNEPVHYADPSYTPVNEPLLVRGASRRCTTPTFWQPLALSQKAAQGGGSVPSDIQTFERLAVGPRAHVRGARRRPAAAARRRVERRLQAGRRRGDPGGVTCGRPARGVDASPLGWNRVAASLPAGSGAACASGARRPARSRR